MKNGETVDLYQICDVRDPGVFCFRVGTARFASAGLLSGDVVTVRRDLEPRGGDFVVIFSRGRFVIRAYCETADDMAADGRGPSVLYCPACDGSSRFFGVVTGAMRRLARGGRPDTSRTTKPQH